MKKIYLIIAAVLFTATGLLPQLAFAQSPEKMSYQAVIRDANDKLMVNQAVGMQISILHTSTSGTVVYMETHAPTTNANGLISIIVGDGTILAGSLDSINWADGPYFIKTETDPTGGTAYTITGSSQLLSVPYALHAKTADSLTSMTPETDPVFMASLAYAITGLDTAIWNNKMSSYTELDPIYTSSVASGIVGTDTANWNAKLSSFTETDPLYTVSPASTILGTDITNWNAKLSSYTETDPIFLISAAGGITGANIVSWNAKLDSEVDGDSTNELQTISITNDTILLTDGGMLILPIRTMLADADSDTKIQVEESADEDMIRFDIAGSEKWVMRGAILEPKNTGNSVFIGDGAGNSDNLTYNNNVFIGYRTGYSNTNGYSNIALGYYSLYANTTGHNNIANGYYSLRYNTTGYNNIANGYNALGSNTAGYHNIANGYNAMYANISGDYNIANGYYALRANTTGNQNIANGSYALYLNTSGYNNIANGQYALRSNTTGYYNNANGYYAMYSNISGHRNIANGYFAMYSNTTGYINVASGYYALRYNTTGIYNTAIGPYAKYYNTTGAYNTALGYRAGYSGTTSNSISIGYNSAGYTNTARIGGTSITSIGGYAAWTTISDERVKNNIQEDVKGLDFIMQLRPVTYYLDKDKMDALAGLKDSSEYAEKYDVNKIKQSGFLAQEVEKAANQTGYDFSGVSKPSGDVKNYGLTYSAFVVPLVKATQEQQTTIEDQQKKIDDLQKELAEIKAMLKQVLEEE